MEPSVNFDESWPFDETDIRSVRVYSNARIALSVDRFTAWEAVYRCQGIHHAKHKCIVYPDAPVVIDARVKPVLSCSRNVNKPRYGFPFPRKIFVFATDAVCA